MINWIEKWLTDREDYGLRVVIDWEVSNWKSVLRGVIQGSVFKENTSDADGQHLQDDLNKLTEWSQKWEMQFNFGKCKCPTQVTQDMGMKMYNT